MVDQKKIQLGGINCQNEKFIKICSCLLINPINKNTYKLEDIGCLPLGKRELVPKHTIPSRSVVQATPGLSDLNWPSHPECHILLGTDYQPLFYGVRSQFSTPYTVIETTALGTKVGGLLGSPKMIETRTNQIRSLMAMNVSRASVGACDSSMRIPEDDCFMHSDLNQSKLDANQFKNSNSINDSCSKNHDHREDSILYKSVDPNKMSFFEQNSDPFFVFTTPKEVLAENGSLVPLSNVCTDIDEKAVSKDTPEVTAKYCNMSNVTIQSNSDFPLDEKICNDSDSHHRAKNMPCHKGRNRDRRKTKGNEPFDSHCQPVADQITTPTVTHINPAMRDVQVFEMPLWQRTLADNLSKDLLECVVGASHPKYDDLLFHSYLDDKNWSLEQRYTFQQCVKKAYKDGEGRYVIPMVFNSKLKDLSNSPHLAKHFIASCQKKAKNDPEYEKKTKDYFTEMIDTGVLEDVPECEINNPNCHYLAWFEVVTGSGEDGKGKFRIVFNAAGKINNLSLNDCLTSAPELTTSILNAAYKFRERRYVIMSDVKKMFFQFGIPEDQRDYLRIIVHEDLNPSKPLKVMRFTRIAFGLKPASMMASLGIQLCARDNLTDAPPHVIRAMLQNLMMDDWVFTSDSILEAGEAGLETIKLGQSCKLSFEKFDSNSFEVLNMIPHERWAKNAGPSSKPIEFKPPVTDNETIFISENKTKLLGTIWNKQTDTLSIKVNVKDVKKITKRTCLSQQNSIYDTYGMVSAVTLKPKILIQEMHKLGISWDHMIPDLLRKAWTEWMNELPLLSEVVIKRPIIKKTGALFTDLHIYTDSSNFAEGFVSFFRTVYNDENDVVFAMGRSCIVPCKAQANVQRLELDACLFACEKIHKVIENLSFKLRNVYFWSDSQYCLRLINDVTAKLSVFEFNRINKIHMLASHFIYCHVPGKINPADAYSRSVSPKELLSNKSLLDGPSNLHSDEPLRIIFPVPSNSCAVHRTVDINCSFCHCPSDSNIAVHNYDTEKYFQPIGSHDFLSLLTALCSRQFPHIGRIFFSIQFPGYSSDSVSALALDTSSRNCLEQGSKNKPKYIDTLYDQQILALLEPDFDKQSWDDYIYCVANFIKFSLRKENCVDSNKIFKQDLNLARDTVLGVAQRLSWQTLLPGLQGKKNFRCPVDLKLDFKHLLQCSAFLDPVSNLIKCFGRYANTVGSYVSDATQEKIVIPDKNIIIRKLVLSIHSDLQHIGPITVAGFLYRDFWLIRAQQYVSNVLSSCIPCKVQKAMCRKPEMAVIPKVRLKSFVVPFTNCGIDCAGQLD